MPTISLINKNKEQVSLIINSIIDMIKNPDSIVNSSAYFYRYNEKITFIVHIYIFKLLINTPDYLEHKYKKYINRFPESIPYNLYLVSNISAKNELDLLLEIKERIKYLDYYYNPTEGKIYFNDKEYVESKWFLSLMAIVLDNTKNDDTREINICYTIPNKHISHISDKDKLDEFLSEFVYYNIKVQRTDKTRQVRENNILIVKNAAINYLKHLKQFKHGLENEESYQLFYNLLTNECRKEGFELYEEEKNLLEVESRELDKIKEFLDDSFYTQPLSKQLHIIENIVWQSSNDITLLEHMNTSLDSLIDLITILKLEYRKTYGTVKKDHRINDINILLLLIVNQFLLTYHIKKDEIDYSLIDFHGIKPKYMNSICDANEQELKSKLKSYDMELSTAKSKLDAVKEERAALDKEKLGADKYQKELERCVSSINRESIIIARLNSNISSLSRTYEELKKKQVDKYRNLDLYNYNRSIIKHICNSIIGCNYYLKTSNNTSVLSNIIIFEDYEKTDNSFYLEVSFKELLKISSRSLINGIIDQNDLPKLA